jgi:DNA-binding MarR family transcriptional regulator
MYFEKKLRSYNLSWAELHALIKITGREGPISQSDITKKLHITKGTTSKTLQKLENDGYITRKRDRKDKRIYRIHLTDKAMKLKPEIYKIRQKWKEKIFKEFKKEEKDLIFSLLHKMVENALRANKE